MLGANSMAFVVAATDKSLRARALGVYAGAQAVGVSAGPVVGGLLLGTLGWPLGVLDQCSLRAACARRRLVGAANNGQQNRGQTFDWRGALMLAPALTFAVLALNQDSAWGPTSPALLGSVGLAIVLIVLFLRQERTSPSPLIDLALVEEPAFLAGALACALSYAMLYGVFFLASFALVSGYEDSPHNCGAQACDRSDQHRKSSPPVAARSPTGSARASSASWAWLSVFVALLALTWVVTKPVANLWIGFFGLVAFGIGLGVFIAPNNHATIGRGAGQSRRRRRSHAQSDAYSWHGSRASPALPPCCPGRSRPRGDRPSAGSRLSRPIISFRPWGQD